MPQPPDLPTGFAGFEPAPLAELLADVAFALQRPADSLRPGDALDDGRGSLLRLAERLATRSLSVDLSHLHTVRQLVGLAVPLRESHPSAHH